MPMKVALLLQTSSSLFSSLSVNHQRSVVPPRRSEHNFEWREGGKLLEANLGITYGQFRGLSFSPPEAWEIELNVLRR